MMKLKIFLASLFPLLAFGQSVPNGGIVQGQVWTASQWVTAWQSKADLPVPLTSLATQAAGTILCNASGTLATPAACGSLPSGFVVPLTNLATQAPGTVLFGACTTGTCLPTAVTLYPQTAAESAASCAPSTCITNFIYPEGNLLRYGAVGDGSTNNYTAIVNALAVAHQTSQGNIGSGSVYVPGGIFRFTPPGLAAGTTAASASQNTSTGVFATASQAFVAGTMVTISGTVPTGFNAGQIYYVISAGLTSTTAELSATSGGSVLVPSGSSSCTLKVETGIMVPSDVKLYGPNRHYDAAVLQPYQSGGLFLDGNGPQAGGSGFVQDIWFDNFILDFQYAIATNVYYQNNAYSVKARDVEINGGSTNLPTFTNTVGIYGQNFDDIFDTVSIYGNSSHVSSSPVCLNIQSNNSSLKFTHSDTEYCATAIYNGSATSTVDFYSPYCESTTTYCYLHNTAAGQAGQTNIFGGSFSGGSGQAYVVNIASDNLLIEGLTIPPGTFTTAAYKTPSVNFAAFPAGTSFKNVKVSGQNFQSGNPALASGANQASIDFGSNSSILTLTTNTGYNLKTLTSGSPTNIFSITTFDLMRCVVHMAAYQSNAFASTAADYLFVIGPGGLGAQAAPALEGTYNNVNSTVNILTFSAPTLAQPTNNEYVFGVTATNSGSGGTSPTIVSVARMDCLSYDAGNAPGGTVIVAN